MNITNLLLGAYFIIVGSNALFALGVTEKALGILALIVGILIIVVPYAGRFAPRQ